MVVNVEGLEALDSWVILLEVTSVEGWEVLSGDRMVNNVERSFVVIIGIVVVAIVVGDELEVSCAMEIGALVDNVVLECLEGFDVNPVVKEVDKVVVLVMAMVDEIGILEEADK